MDSRVTEAVQLHWSDFSEQRELPGWQTSRLRERLAACLSTHREPDLRVVSEKLLKRGLPKNISAADFDFACVAGSLLKVQRQFQAFEHRDRVEWHSSRSLVGACTAELAARSWTGIDPSLASHCVLLFETSIVAMSRLLGPDYRRLMDRVLLQCPVALGTILENSERERFGFSHLVVASVFASLWGSNTPAGTIQFDNEPQTSSAADSSTLKQIVDFADGFSTWCQRPDEQELSTLFTHPAAQGRRPELVYSLLRESIGRADTLATMLCEPKPFHTARGVIDAYLRFHSSSERTPR